MFHCIFIFDSFRDFNSFLIFLHNLIVLAVAFFSSFNSIVKYLINNQSKCLFSKILLVSHVNSIIKFVLMQTNVTFKMFVNFSVK